MTKVAVRECEAGNYSHNSESKILVELEVDGFSFNGKFGSECFLYTKDQKIKISPNFIPLSRTLFDCVFLSACNSTAAGTPIDITIILRGLDFIGGKWQRVTWEIIVS